MTAPITLADLNQFLILQIERQGTTTRITGRPSKPGQPSPDEHMSLHINSKEGVPGQLTEVDPDGKRAVLRTVAEVLHPAVVPNASFPMYDSYWSDRIRMVLNESITWTRQRFVSPDAFVQASPQGGRMWRVAEAGDEKRTDGEIVPGGWDHEHCELCWRTVGSGGDPEGYINSDGDWVCTRCHQRFVEPRDLRFASGWPDAEDVQSPEQQSFEILSRLIDEYDLDGIRKYVGEGGSLNVSNRYGWTPLMFAALRGHKSLVALLIANGVDVNAVAGETGYSALANAAQAGHLEVVRLLLSAGATANVPESLCGGSLLQYVKTGRGQSDPLISQLLTDAGAK